MKVSKLAVFVLGSILCAAPARGGGAAPATRPDPTTFPSTELFENAPELELFQDMPIVVAATKHEQSTKEAPASVSVVTASDIELFGYQNLADILRNQRSFYLETDGLNWFAGVRGFSRPSEWNSRLLIAVDDRPTNELVYGQSHLDTDFVVPMEAIKQVEIIRGPGSALYGTNAVFGVINVVTKDGADVNGVQATATVGSLLTAQGNVLFGKVIDGWDILADFNGYTTQGDDEVHFDGVTGAINNNGNIDGAGYEGAYEGFLKASKGEFTLEADLESRHKDDSDATWDTSFYNPGSMTEERHNVMMKIDHEIDSAQSLHAMAYYGFYSYWQVEPYATGTAIQPNYFYTGTANDHWVGQDVHYDYKINKQLRAMVGVDATESLYIVQRDYDSTNGLLLNIPGTYAEWAAFGELECNLTDWLSLTAGVRQDQVQRVGANTSPRIALVATPTKNDTFKALYGRAFRDPNINELTYYSPGNNTPNPNLRPEIVDTWELDWERQLGDGWSACLDGYYWELHNTMDVVTLADGTGQTQNEQTTTARGIEAEIDRRWGKRATFRAYATYTGADESGGEPTQSPPWIVGTSLAMPIIMPHTYFSVDPQIVGPMKSSDGAFTNPTYITNATITSGDILPNWTFQVGAYNLFANSARLPGTPDQIEPTINYPGTEFRITASCKF